MNLGDIIHDYREKNKLSMDEFAKLANMSKPYVSMLESNKNSKTGKPIVPSLKTIQNCARAMNMSVDGLMRTIDQEIDITPAVQAPAIQPVTFETLPVPLIGDIAAGTPINAEQNIQDYIPVNRAVVDRCNGECFCLKVEGSSMIPEICDGDIIVVDSVIDPSRINARDNIVVMIETTATVKHLSITEKGFLLTANNPDVYEPHFYDCDQVKKLPVIIAGKVVSLQREF